MIILGLTIPSTDKTYAILAEAHKLRVEALVGGIIYSYDCILKEFHDNY